MKKSWNEVSISEWKAIKEIVESDMEPLEKNVETIAVLEGLTPNQVWAMPMYKIQQITNTMGWMENFEFNQKARLDRVKIDGQVYDITTDLNRLTVAAYSDFQFYMENRDENMGLILTCFIIPKGKEYGEGYDVKELAKLFEDKLSIVFWNEVFFSLIKNSLYSIKALEIYLDWKARRNPEIRELLNQKLTELRDTYGFLL